ncbi:hypothetical protein HO173_002315 [Letharia columbiana]|uniref:Uncharacterized protein n=1 Tax=Letharia columbiana TaxID=112416 RepID=A0A8H6L8U1_9LECA|nr:uncharacterized protein HO173_002315 [Letharia columbiana]KAF6239769.1 hypothetical protein HO173_002315 [Letharia columbiana]
MPVQIVVDISSDEEDNAAKSSTKTRSTGEQPTDSTRTFAKSPSRTSLTADKPTLSPPETAGCSESLRERTAKNAIHSGYPDSNRAKSTQRPSATSSTDHNNHKHSFHLAPYPHGR